MSLFIQFGPLVGALIVLGAVICGVAERADGRDRG